MLEITVKTLDSQNHTFSVPDEITVKEFKEKISPSLGIAVDKQRLIFCGRVLQDDKKLQEYDVNGKVIHLVQRPPPQPNVPRGAGSGSGNASTETPPRQPGPQFRRTESTTSSSFLLGAFTIPQEMIDPDHVQQIVHDVVSGMGEMGRNATVMSQTSADGSSMDIHINLGHVSLQNEVQQRLNIIQSMGNNIRQLLDTLENRSSEAAHNTEATETSSSTENPPASNASGNTAATPAPPESLQSMTRLQIQMPAVIGGATATPASATTTGPIRQASIEGLAQAARAAIAAAVAAATGAATSAARMATSRSSEPPPQQRSGSQNTTQEQTTAAGNGLSSTQNTTPRHPTRATLPNLLEEIQELQQRFAPHFQNFTSQLRQDPTLTATQSQAHQEAFNAVSQVLHYFSHIYHAISDFHVIYNFPPPRHLRVRINGISPTTVIQTSLPFQPPSSQATSGSQASQPSAATASSANQSSTTEATAIPTPVENNQHSSVTGQNDQPSASTPLLIHIPREVSTNSSAARQSSQQQSSVAESTGAPPPSQTETPLASQQAPATGGSEASQQHRNAIFGGGAGLLGGPLLYMEVEPPTFSLGLGRSSPSSAAFTYTLSSPSQTSSTNTTAGSTGSTSTTTGSGGASSSIPTATPHIHGIHVPLTASPSAARFDPCLPCMSRWVEQNNSSAQHAPRSAPQPANTIPNDLQHLVTSLLAPNIQVVGPRAGSRSQSFFQRILVPTQQSQATTADNSSNTTQNTSAQTAAASPQPPASAPNRGISDDLFMSIIRTFLVPLSTRLGPNASQNIQELLGRFEEASYVEGENILCDLFMCMAQSLELGEMAAVLYGDPRPLNRVQSSLQQFVTQRVLHGQPATPANLSQVIQGLLEPCQSTLQALARDCPVRPDIDYVATMNHFASERLTSLLTLLVDSPTEGNYFGERLYHHCQQSLLHLLALNIHCLQQDSDSLDRLVQVSLRSIMGDMTPMFQSWIVNLTTSTLRAMVPLATSSPLVAIVEQHVVRKSTSSSEDHSERMDMSSSTSPAPATEKTEDAMATPTVNSQPGEMEVESGAAIPAPTEPPQAPSPPPADQSWTTAVPREWVPIITQDIQRQRRQAPQPPFSDAYLAGMPTKRRKLCTNNNAQVLTTAAASGSVLPSALCQAIEAAGVRPLTSLDQVQQEIREEDTSGLLGSLYQDTLRSSIRDRLQRDPDFRAERFPHTSTYFLSSAGSN